MCGRFVHPDTAAIESAWHVGRRNSNPFDRCYNVLPTSDIPVLRADADSGVPELVAARWGFIPFWWKDARPPKATINARFEEAAAKPMWRDAFRRARCLIPAEGWYEWRGLERVDPGTGEVKGYKQPYFMRRADGARFCFAGLIAYWQRSGAAALILSCAILTRAAAGSVAEIHDRMPVVLPNEAHAHWLGAELSDPAGVAEIIAESAQSAFVYAPVSTAINGRVDDSPRLIEPIALQHP